MFTMKNMKVATKLHLLVAVSVLGLFVFGVASYLMLSKVKVGGPFHREMVVYFDLAGDILPPALNLERVRFAARVMMSEDIKDLPQGIAMYQERKKNYEEAVASWANRLPDGKIKDLIAVQNYKIGESYMDTVEKRLIPALQSGNRKQISDAAEQCKALSDAGLAVTEEAIHLIQAKQAELDQQAEAAIRNLVLALLGIGLVIGVLVGALGLATGRGVASGTANALQLAEAIAEGNLTQDDMDVAGKDELAELGNALNKMKKSLHEVIQSITEAGQHIASASEEFSSTSQQITANSEETSAQSNVVAQAAQQVNTNLQSVSTGAEEMNTTIQSIASNAHEAATIASNAVQTAQAANATVSKLGESSAEIGEVIKVITSIAQQTKLLALNATIEAARAGEAGKGFAVVANEVKELARQTAKATEDISRKITAIQTDTQGAVEAIGTISTVINQVNDISGTIATAVEEQSATTNEMTRNVADAAKGSTEITQNIAGVAEAAQGTSSSAQESQKAANELAEMAARLRSLVEQFKIAGSTSEMHRPAPAQKMKARAASASR